jgi:hypothetical protein
MVVSWEEAEEEEEKWDPSNAKNPTPGHWS